MPWLGARYPRSIYLQTSPPNEKKAAARADSEPTHSLSLAGLQSQGRVRGSSVLRSVLSPHPDDSSLRPEANLPLSGPTYLPKVKMLGRSSSRRRWGTVSHSIPNGALTRGRERRAVRPGLPLLDRLQRPARLAVGGLRWSALVFPPNFCKGPSAHREWVRYGRVPLPSGPSRWTVGQVGHVSALILAPGAFARSLAARRALLAQKRSTAQHSTAKKLWLKPENGRTPPKLSFSFQQRARHTRA